MKGKPNRILPIYCHMANQTQTMRMYYYYYDYDYGCDYCYYH